MTTETTGDTHVTVPIEVPPPAPADDGTERAPNEQPPATPDERPPHAQTAQRISAAFAEKQFIHPTAVPPTDGTGDDATSAPRSEYYPDLSSPGSVLFRAVREAGRWCFGAIAVECWVMNDDTHKLERPPGGLWIDPAFLACEIPDNVALMRLLDESRTDYVPPAPVGPGVGLPGALWAQTAEATPEALERWGKMGDAGAQEKELDRRAGGDERSRRRPPPEGAAAGRNTRGRRSLARSRRGTQRDSRRVTFQEIGPLAVDPDQPYNPRLILLARAGFGLGAGVRFKLSGHRGVVIFYARATADRNQLYSKNNTVYLLRSADAIGAASALEEPRRACIDERRREGQDAWRRARTKIGVAMALEGGLKEVIEKEKMEKKGGTFFSRFPKPDDINASMVEKGAKSFFVGRWEWFKRYLKKCSGGNNKPPPSFSNKETLFTFLGAFITLLIITQINRLLTERSESFKFLVMGPFGALTTLQYGLTAAPASQPRNAIFGQAIAIALATGISFIGMPDWAKQTIATSIAIAIMVRLGITHPPAGASALLFSTAQDDWVILGLMLLANVIAIAIATLINNLNPRRQYPTFWGGGYVRHIISGGEKDPLLKPVKKK